MGRPHRKDWQNDTLTGPFLGALELDEVEQDFDDVYARLALGKNLANEARNVILTGGGTITWRSQDDRLKWTNRFILLPVPTTVAPDGFVDIDFPASVLDHNGNERRTADGIYLIGWEALVLTHTRGATSGSGNQLRVIFYQPGQQADLLEREDSYIIALHNGDEGTLTLRNGLTLAPGGTSVGGVTSGGGGGGGSATPAATTATTSRTLTATEEYVRASGTITLTLPDASVARAAGYIIQNVGTGLVTIQTSSGDLMHTLGSISSDQQYDVVWLRPGDANTWGIVSPKTGGTGGASGTSTGVDTLSALRDVSSDSRAGSIKVARHSVPGDGGGGYFRWEAMPAVAFTATAADDTINITNHSFLRGHEVRLYSLSGAIGPNTSTVYFVGKVTTNSFVLVANFEESKRATPTAVNISANGAGYINFADDNGMTIVPADNPQNGRWVREWQHRYIAPEWFGARGNDSTFNSSTAIQRAINHGSLVKSWNTISAGAEVILGNKEYYASGLIVRTGTHIDGVNHDVSRIIPPSGSTNEFIVGMERGALVGVELSNFQIRGAGIAGQHGMYFLAKDDLPGGRSDGGMWFSALRNIWLEGMHADAHSIWFRGGENTFNLPNQFIDLQNVHSYNAGGNGRSFKASGQCGQFTHTNCSYAGQMYPIMNSGVGLELIEITGTAPYAHTFNTCTFERVHYGAKIDRCSDITFVGCYFEACYRGGIDAEWCQGLHTRGQNFRNVHNDVTPGDGFLVRMTYCTGSYGENVAYGTIDKRFVNSGKPVELYRDLIDDDTTMPAWGGNTSQKAAASTLNLGGFNHLLVEGATTIDTINSHIPPGHLLMLRAHNGSITFSESGNLHLTGRGSPFTVSSGRVVTFVRNDLFGAWWLVSVSA